MNGDTHYSDYIAIPENFRANMTRDAIDESPETWMRFYPHETFLKILDELLETIDGGTKSIWITGNYGTGKSNAALVIQKLFNDDISRVNDWFESYHDNFKGAYKSIQSRLLIEREEGTLVVYDYNAGGLGPNEELLVRLEKSIVLALDDAKMRVPSNSPLNRIMNRISEEGDRFFKTRDEVADKIRHIPSNINNADDLNALLSVSDSESLESIQLIEDVETILRARDIYLNVSVESLKTWIKEVLRINGLSRIVYIFDEFSDFIESNKATLKTFEDISETPDNSGFYFIPVTHIGINAFYSENSDSASKSKNRFEFVNLKMPENIAFELMSHAINQGVKHGMEQAWENVKDELWVTIKDVADSFDAEHISGFKETMRNILPVHPMAGHMLKALSECVGSNQRSIFEYLKDTSHGSTFSSFIQNGGPQVWGKSILTVDYLWDYFVMRDDLGTPKEVTEVRIYYERFKKGTRLSNETDDSPIVRVFKTILLFILLSRLAKDGNPLLQPTEENLELAYSKDSSVGYIRTHLNDLEKISCISLLDGRIELFSSSASETALNEQIEKYQNRFDLIYGPTEKKIADQWRINGINSYPKDRFVVKVTDESKIKSGTFNQSARDPYEAGESKDNGAFLLWFSISKNHQSSLLAGDNIRRMLESLEDKWRVLFFTFKDVTFCGTNEDEWSDYIKAVASKELETSSSAREIWSQKIMQREQTWQTRIAGAEIEAYYWDGKVCTEVLEWSELSDFLEKRLHQHLEFNVDKLITVPTSCLKESQFRKWALAGLEFDGVTSGEEKGVVDRFVKNGISSDSDWFSKNPDHPLSRIHDVIISTMKSSLKSENRFDLVKAYRKLRKSPYGLQNVGFTGFVLGFCMRELVGSGYQWTDEKTTGELDVGALAEIIDTTIRGSSAKPSSGQKHICLMSEQDRRFFADAPKMFGSSYSGNNLEGTIQIIDRSCIEKSGKVPIWVLPEYIRSKGDEDAEEISEALAKVIIVLSTSSKGKIEERSRAVREVGDMLISDPELPSKVSAYINKETLDQAFRHYLEINYPDLIRKAEEVKDINSNYIDSVCDKMAVTASYLWKECDLKGNVSEVISQYGVIGAVRQLTSQSHFISYGDAVNSLSSHVDSSKLPCFMIVSAYPQLDTLKYKINQLKAPQQASVMEDIVSYLEQNLEIIKKLFFNVDSSEVVNIVRDRMPTNGLSDRDIEAILRRMGPSYDKSESSYVGEFERKADEIRESSLKNKLSQLWKEKTSTESVKDWESVYGIPGRYAFLDPEASGMFEVVLNPDSYKAEKLEQAITILSSQQSPDIELSRDAFMKDVVPSRYSDLLQYSAVAEFLKSEYGEPGRWAANPDVSSLVHKTYRSAISPVASNLVGKMDADELKSLILKAIEENEELGIEIMQVIR